MATKDEVLRLLQENSEVYISGQEMADRLHVTRAAVWKAIKALEKEGCAIEAVTNRGYRLGRAPDAIDAPFIERSLRESGLNVRVIFKEETGSTNEDARSALRDWVSAGDPVGNSENSSMGNSSDDPADDPARRQRAVLVIADKQNAGRGRRGRDFYSPPGTGLYMSLAMGNVQEVLKMARVTAVAAVAVADAVDETVFDGDDRTAIKWVNDIYIGEKKVCGILSEAFLPMEDEEDGCVVVGIGINVYEPTGGFPEDIDNRAGALITLHESSEGAVDGSGTENRNGKESVAEARSGNESSGEGGVTVDPGRTGLRSVLASRVIAGFFKYMAAPELSLKKYREKSNLIGHEITINDFRNEAKDRPDKTAVVIEIDDECRLVVEYPDGRREALSSGEVSVVKSR
ncbi:MAG: biotin--[Lachnospiraceae bacterium]|nr:biotin--[acetyl-CoA-carboxylase] ligase [Lachnospiraceae bacterium]